MAHTDLVAASLVKHMDAAFNDPQSPPVGDLAGPTQLRPGWGLPALDNFEDCAMAWVLAGTRSRTQSFPTISDVVRCDGSRLWEFSVGVARCSVALEEGARLPSLETMEAEYATQEDDKDRLEYAVCQAMDDLGRRNIIANYAFGPVEVYGPQGATIAVHRTILVTPTGRRKK